MPNTLLELNDLPDGDPALGALVQQNKLYESSELWEEGVKSIEATPHQTIFGGIKEVVNNHLKVSALVFGAGSVLIGAAAGKRVVAR